MKKVYYLLFALFLCGSYTASAQSVKDSFEIYFEFNKAIVKQISKTQIDSFLRVTTGRRLMTRIVGHACDIGTDDYNMKLSEDRAKSAFEYLRGTGEPEEKTELLFYGESQQKYTIQEREKNRRVFFQYTLEDEDRDTLLKSGCMEVFIKKFTYKPAKNKDMNFEIRNINTAAAFRSNGLPLMDNNGKRLTFNAVVFISTKLKGQETKPGQVISVKMPAVTPNESGYVLYRLDEQGGKKAWVNTGKTCEAAKAECEYYPQELMETGFCACAKERLCPEDCSEEPFGGERNPDKTAADVKSSNLGTVARFSSAEAANGKEIFEDTKSKGIPGFFQEDLDVCGQFMAGVTTDDWFPNYYQDGPKAKRNIIFKGSKNQGSGGNVTIYIPRSEVKGMEKPVLVTGNRNESKGFIRWDRDKFEPKTCLGPVNCEYVVFEVPATGNYKLTERVEASAPKKETGTLLKTRVLKNTPKSPTVVFIGNTKTNYVYKASNAKRGNKVRKKEYALIKVDEKDKANTVVLVQHTTKKGKKMYQEAKLTDLKYKKKKDIYIMRKKNFKKVKDFKEMQLNKCK
jgi:hypothetical protein